MFNKEREEQIRKIAGFNGAHYLDAKNRFRKHLDELKTSPSLISYLDLACGSGLSNDSGEFKFHPYDLFAAWVFSCGFIVGIDIAPKAPDYPDIQHILKADLVKVVNNDGLKKFLENQGCLRQFDLIYNRHFSSVGFSPSLERQLGHNHAQLFLFDHRIEGQAKELLVRGGKYVT